MNLDGHLWTEVQSLAPSPTEDTGPDTVPGSTESPAPKGEPEPYTPGAAYAETLITAGSLG